MHKLYCVLALFLVNYLKSFKEAVSQMSLKGKEIIGQQQEPLEKKCTTSEVIKWHPPDPGWTKLNVDGAFSAESGAASTGYVLRNHAGTVIMSGGCNILRASAAEEVEAMACRDGLRSVVQWIEGPVWLESDCSSVVAKLKKTGMTRSRWCFIYQEIKELMQRLPGVGVGFCVAHELARFTGRNGHDVLLHGQGPACIQALVVHDSNSVS